MTVGADPVVVGYEALAPACDKITRGYDYDRWLAAIERRGHWARSLSLQRQRHWPALEVEAAATAMGHRVVAVLGQRTGVALDAELDESLHTKALFLAVSAQEGGEGMDYGRP
jgi:hypothetical protein